MNGEDFPGVDASAITTFDITDAASFTTAKTEIEASAGSYILNIPSGTTVDLEDINLTPAAGAVVSLRGGGTLKNSSGTDAYLFTLTGAGTKLILRDAVLEGHVGNGSALVCVGTGTEFAMSGGAITGNTTGVGGGGVYVGNDGTFTMSGGTISGNNASYYGGGVVVDGGSFTMSGGTIGGNDARVGGGVYVDKNGSFTKTGNSTIYGSDEGGNSNTVGFSGHAVYVFDGMFVKYRNTSAGPGVDMDSNAGAGDPMWGALGKRNKSERFAFMFSLLRR
jgi:hypothetical protein